MKTREEDFVAQLIIDSTHAYLLCFTNTGRVYWLKVYEIPDVGAAGKGKAMASLIDLQPGEKVVTILPVSDLRREDRYVLFATRNGTVKKTPLRTSQNVMARGIIAINIDKDDELITARITDGQQVIFLATHDGMAIRFDETYRVVEATQDAISETDEAVELSEAAEGKKVQQEHGPPPHGPPRHRQPRHHPPKGRLRHRRRRHPLTRKLATCAATKKLPRPNCTKKLASVRLAIREGGRRTSLCPRSSTR